MDSFLLEKFANNQLHQKPHPGLLPLLAFYNHGGYCNLIFPLADGDLTSYFRTRHHPRNSSERLKFIEAICVLTSALGVIHNGESDHVTDANGTEIYGYHRDLKYALSDWFVGGSGYVLMLCYLQTSKHTLHDDPRRRSTPWSPRRS